MGPKTKTDRHLIGKVYFEFRSDIIDGKEMDTKITTEQGTLCWIAGEDKAKFVYEFTTLVEKYRI